MRHDRGLAASPPDAIADSYYVCVGDRGIIDPLAAKRFLLR
jgi:hypothetical protein